MTEFDELLYDVLSSDATAEPPAGMEARISAALASTLRGRAEPQSAWIWAATAAVLIAAAGSIALRYLSSAVPMRMAPTPLVASQSAGNSAAQAPAKVALKRSHRAATVTRSRPNTERDIGNIAPLEIRPIAIEPLQIASLKTGNINNEGEIR